MSHELRTPLNAILGFANMLRRDRAVPTGQRDMLDIIAQSGDHLLALINDVLDLAKIEAGRMEVVTAPFDLGAMVRDVTNMMSIRAQEKGLLLLLEQASILPRFIKSDEMHLRQVLVNLVGNAIKFTNQGGVTIRLGTMSGSLDLIIEVEDSGPGIELKDQERLFQPFVQLAESGTQKGTGLGLAISRRYIELMGGTLTFKSTPGKGTIFRIVLPVELADSETVTVKVGSHCEEEVSGLAPGQPSYRILIAEDQPVNQLLLAKLMTDIGLEVKVANNGEQCVQLFQDWHPHFIWMDRRMPVMNGDAAARIIRTLPEGDIVKIVAVTASVFREQQQELLEAGMDDVLRKPYQFREIYDCLSRHLGLKYVYQEREHEEPFEQNASPSEENNGSEDDLNDLMKILNKMTAAQ
jgi:CheY-like chemotaxis protein/anti-sigma regulatory factor (Ser/Thr protein kinase)